MNKSSVFHVYNILKQDTKDTPAITLARLNKALGIVMTKDYVNKYYTTMTSCTCPDSSQRGFFVCKHRLALFMQNAQETLLLRFNGEGPWDPIYKGR
jgi:hypothetical protein